LTNFSDLQKLPHHPVFQFVYVRGHAFFTSHYVFPQQLHGGELTLFFHPFQSLQRMPGFFPPSNFFTFAAPLGIHRQLNFLFACFPLPCFFQPGDFINHPTKSDPLSSAPHLVPSPRETLTQASCSERTFLTPTGYPFTFPFSKICPPLGGPPNLASNPKCGFGLAWP